MMVHSGSRDQSDVSAGLGLDRTKIANFATVAAKYVDTLHRFYSHHTPSTFDLFAASYSWLPETRHTSNNPKFQLYHYHSTT